jgi:hypothetical protein
VAAVGSLVAKSSTVTVSVPVFFHLADDRYPRSTSVAWARSAPTVALCCGRWVNMSKEYKRIAFWLERIDRVRIAGSEVVVGIADARGDHAHQHLTATGLVEVGAVMVST